jgi:hypothetical protein
MSCHRQVCPSGGELPGARQTRQSRPGHRKSPGRLWRRFRISDTVASSTVPPPHRRAALGFPAVNPWGGCVNVFTPRSLFQKSRRTSAVATVGLSALLLVGCGGGEDEEATEAPAAQATTAPAQSPTRAASSPSPTEPAAGDATPTAASAATPAAQAATPAAARAATPIPSVATPALRLDDAPATPMASPVATPAT